MKMMEAGLLDFWYGQGLPDVHQCSDNNHFNDRRNISALNLKNLTGAFSILVVGYILSIVVFIFENVFRRIKIKMCRL